MEIATEIKAKVFAQYLGQRFVRNNDPGTAFESFGVSFFGMVNFGSEIPFTLDNIKLILKPLSKITQDDAFSISLAARTNADHVKKIFTTYNAGGYAKTKEWLGITSIYEYLRNHGYDLPNYLLPDGEGKHLTLQQAGLAIYEA